MTAVADIDIVQVARTRIQGMRYKARTGGGEWCGPCPTCGGFDRLVVNGTGGQDDRGLFWCRQCGASGDAVALVALLDGVTPGQAMQTLGVGMKPSGRPGRYTAPRLQTEPIAPAEPPPPAWRARALEVHAAAESALWSEAGATALAYLRKRGLSDDTIRAARLGYVHKGRMELRSLWGLANEGAFSLPLHRGILIPYLVDGEIWRLEVRRPVTAQDWVCAPGKFLAPGNDATGAVWRALKRLPYASAAKVAREANWALAAVEEALAWLAGEKLIEHPARYVTVAGSSNAVWGTDAVVAGRPGVLVEGVLNALSVQQAAGDLVNCFAIGATTHGRRVRWVVALGQCAGCLIATDADASASKGDAAADWWVGALAPQAVRWRPTRNDCNAMLTAGDDLRAWVLAGLAMLPQAATPAAPAAKPARVCARCGQALEIGELCPDCAEAGVKTWRGVDWEEGVSAADEATIAREEERRAQPAEDAALGSAPWTADQWLERMTELLEAASDEVQETWGAYQYAYVRRQPTGELAEDLRALGGGPILRAWMEAKAWATMDKLRREKPAERQAPAAAAQ